MERPARITGGIVLSLVMASLGCMEFGWSGGDAGWGGMGGAGTMDSPFFYPVGTVVVEVPLSDGETTTAQIWFSAAEGASGPLHRYGDLISGEAMDGLAPDCRGAHSVFLFSHTSGTVRYQSFAEMEERASLHGIVIAIDHPGDTWDDHDEERWPEVVMQRPVQISEVFDWYLAESVDPDSPFYGCNAREDRYISMGHGAGAFTALALAGAQLDMERMAAICIDEPVAGCDTVVEWTQQHPMDRFLDRSDPRVWSAMAWAPVRSAILLEGLAEVEVPVLLLEGGEDSIGDASLTWSHLETVPRYMGCLTGAGHYGFTSICDLLPEEMDSGCTDDYELADEILTWVGRVQFFYLLKVSNPDYGVTKPANVELDYWLSVEE